MTSIIPGLEYDIFISYRQKDNKGDRWVSEFVEALKTELESTFKEEVSVYFDINPHDGLLETHDVDASLKEKLKCAVFIPILSRTYCDPKSFAWIHEFKAFIELASKDQFGLKVKLPGGNIASRVLPVQIHDLDSEDKNLVEEELGGYLRGIEFIYNEPGVNKPLKPDDDEKKNQSKTKYSYQVNKVTNAVKGIISGLKNPEADQKIRVENEEERIYNPLKKPSRKIITIVAIIALIVVPGYFILPVLLKPVPTIEKSIAVLPFINDNISDTNNPIIKGIGRDISVNLQSIGDLLVISQYDVSKYQEPGKFRLREIAKDLNVNYLVTGNGQRLGSRIVLRIELTDCSKDRIIWSQPFAAELDNIMDFYQKQSQIAIRIASELKSRITPEEVRLIQKTPTTQNIAFEFFQKGNEEYLKYYLDNRKRESLNNAEKYYYKAIKNDSTYTQAIVGLAFVYWSKNYREEYFSKHFLDSVLILADKALSYDKNTAEAYLLKGNYFKEIGDHIKALGQYEIALSLNPNLWQAYSSEGDLFILKVADFRKGLEKYLMALKLNHGKERSTLYNTIGYYFDHLGFFDLAITSYKKALIITNDSAYYFNKMAWLENRRGNLNKAFEYGQKSFILDTTNIDNLMLCANVYLWHNKEDKALKYCREYLKRLGPLKDIWIQEVHRVGYFYWKTGNKKEALKCFSLQKQYCEDAISLNREYASNAFAYYDLADIYAFEGNKVKAYENLHTYDKRNEDITFTIVNFFNYDPMLGSIRNEPDFKSIKKSIESKYKRTYESIKRFVEENNILKNLEMI